MIRIFSSSTGPVPPGSASGLDGFQVSTVPRSASAGCDSDGVESDEELGSAQTWNAH